MIPATQSNRRILIVDDSRTIHEDYRKILMPDRAADALAADEAALFDLPPTTSAAPVFTVDSAYQGQEGLMLVERALAEGTPYAMAFMDVRMPPGWDGIETAARIWEIDPAIQIVVCTAYSDYSWDETVAKLGHSDRLMILKKPFDTVEVLQLATALTEKWQRARVASEHLARLERIVREGNLQDAGVDLPGRKT